MNRAPQIPPISAAGGAAGARPVAAAEAAIEGAVGELQKIVDRLTAGKRVSCRVNGDTVTVITWRDITPEEEE
jgi:hypothetical protein